MLSQKKALYQTKLILNCLPEEEYKLIPKEDIDYIENNYEYDENIIIKPDIPLEKQKIDDKTYNILEKIIKKAEANQQEYNNTKASEYANNLKISNTADDIQMENIRLKEIIKSLEKENHKIPKAKELVEDYQDVLIQKDAEILRLKENNEILYKSIIKIPKFIRKIFIKETDIELLNEGNQVKN